jgi:hypothetical protein
LELGDELDELGPVVTGIVQPEELAKRRREAKRVVIPIVA